MTFPPQLKDGFDGQKLLGPLVSLFQFVSQRIPKAPGAALLGPLGSQVLHRDLYPGQRTGLSPASLRRKSDADGFDASHKHGSKRRYLQHTHYTCMYYHLLDIQTQTHTHTHTSLEQNHGTCKKHDRSLCSFWRSFLRFELD